MSWDLLLPGHLEDPTRLKMKEFGDYRFVDIWLKRGDRRLREIGLQSLQLDLY